ncbi:hypothetical protein, partial [Microvirga zambiensis]|uniref:hypothetical protein n=1 Tax=Microvirga zambiensis TaxID=1402137 RepID=UPI001AEFBAA0
MAATPTAKPATVIAIDNGASLIQVCGTAPRLPAPRHCDRQRFEQLAHAFPRLVPGISAGDRDAVKRGASRIANDTRRVMPGLVPGTHVLAARRFSKTWVAAPSAAMTRGCHTRRPQSGNDATPHGTLSVKRP